LLAADSLGFKNTADQRAANGLIHQLVTDNFRFSYSEDDSGFASLAGEREKRR
jgi:hypothetical protein